MIKPICIVLGASACLAVQSCSTDTLQEMTDRAEDAPQFISMTREGDTEERTYRVVGGYYSDHDFSPKGVITGTYRGIQGQKMIPCRLNPDGSIDETASDEDHLKSGVASNAGTKLWMYISPGIELTDLSAYISSVKYNPYKTDLLMSADVIKKEVSSGIKFGALMERRARLRFCVFIGENNNSVKELSIDKFTLLGASDPDIEINYLPWVPQVENNDLFTTVEMVEDMYDTTQTNRYVNANEIYVASGYYAPKEIIRSLDSTCGLNYLVNSRYLSAEMTLKLGGQGEVNIAPLLTDKVILLKPMHEYTYNFIVNTEYVNVTLEVCDCGSHPQAWKQENTEDGDQVIGPLGDKVTIDLGKWKIGDDNGWTPAVSEDQII